MSTATYVQLALGGSSLGLERGRRNAGSIRHQLNAQIPPWTRAASLKTCSCGRAVVRASASSQDSPVGRRELLAGAAVLLAAAPSLNNEALAGKAPKGYAAHQDSIDNYAFFYPFGWQEVAVKGQDVVFKDVIEPLENVSVNIIKTEKTSLAELGSPNEVARTLVEKVLSSPSQKVTLVDAKERETDGKTYYSFEFLAQAPNYTRHALGTVALANGRFYTLTTGANERRWSKMEDKLKAIADSFVTF